MQTKHPQGRSTARNSQQLTPLGILLQLHTLQKLVPIRSTRLSHDVGNVPDFKYRALLGTIRDDGARLAFSLDEALLREALDGLPNGHPRRAETLGELQFCRYSRSRRPLATHDGLGQHTPDLLPNRSIAVERCNAGDQPLRGAHPMRYRRIIQSRRWHSLRLKIYRSLIVLRPPSWATCSFV